MTQQILDVFLVLVGAALIAFCALTPDIGSPAVNLWAVCTGGAAMGIGGRGLAEHS